MVVGLLAPASGYEWQPQGLIERGMHDSTASVDHLMLVSLGELSYLVTFFCSYHIPLGERICSSLWESGGCASRVRQLR